MRRPAYVRLVLLSILSPTWALAALVKPPGDRALRARVIVALNAIYLTIALTSLLLVFALFGNHARPLQAGGATAARVAWAYFLWSRCAEVLIAFHRDALDKLAGKAEGSSLTGAGRVVLALNSYLELIINHALLYCLVPTTMWREPIPESVSDLLWYSASTITTSGGGGFTPKRWLPQLLSSLEVFGGVILLVVCFTLYASSALASKTEPRVPSDD